MKDEDKTKEQLISELTQLRRRVVELEKSETEHTEKLLETEAMFQGLFEHAPDAIVAVNRKGRIIQANTQAENIFGYNRDELQNQHVEILIPARFRKRHEEHMKNYFSNPRFRFMGSELGLYALRRDGTEFPVDIALSYFETREGIVVLSIIRDIAEHKHMEEELLANEAKYRGIFENAAEGIFQTTVEGRILAANPALARMLGYETPEELIAGVPDVRKLYVEPGRRLEFIRLVKMQGAVTDFEALLRRKDGNEIWVQINAHAVHDPEGKLAGFEGMAMDITSRKRAQRNFQRLIDAAPDAIIAIDSEYKILLINTQTENLFGYNREELVGKPYPILIPERFREKHAELCAGYFAKPGVRKMALHLGAFAKRRDGTEFPVELNMSPIETEGGVIVVADIRESRMLR